MTLLRRLFKEEEGQGLVEYSLILAVLAVGILVFGEPLADAIKGIWDEIITDMGGTPAA